MAGGYLGKISAIVTANTGDFKPKLDAAASDVQKFARSMEGTLRSASAQSARAFDGIWMPLQRMERAIQAASTMKLSFKGIDIAIRDVDALNARFASLAKRQMEMSSRGTGFGSSQQLRDAFRGIRSEDVSFVRDIGGLAQARGLREAMTPREQKSVDKFAAFGSLEQMDKIVSVLNARSIEESKQKMRQMASAAAELGKPLTATVSKLDTLSLEIQGQFAPAMAKASRAVENFRDAAEKGAVSEKYFEGVRRRVDETTAAVLRLEEAQKLARSGATGNELAFRAPRASDELARSAELSRAAAQAPVGVRASAGFAGQVAELDTLRSKITAYQAAVERRQLLNLDTTEAAAKLDQMIARSAAVRQSIESSMSAEGAARAKAVAIGEVYLNVLQKESQAISLTGESLDQYERRLQSEADAKTRATAAGEMFLRVLQKESQAISLTGESLDQYEQRLRRQEDAKNRAQNANMFLPPVLQRESGLLSNAGERTVLSGDYFLRSIRRPVDDAKAAIVALGDVPLAATLGPQIDRITTRFNNLTRDAAAARDQIRQVTASVRDAKAVQESLKSREELADQFMRSGGGRGEAGLDLGVDTKALRGAAAEIELLQSRLSGFSAEARGPAVAALEKYRAAVAQAFRDGSISTTAGKQALEQYKAEVIKTAAAVTGISPKKLAADMKRAGDVGRGSFGNLGLAVQQAAFIFDDFFSVTGGLDQRIRAVGNNISQLGFILGGTSGLVAGVAASITAQLIVSYIKWSDAGVDTETRLRAINDTMSRQKSLVESLASAFSSLADEIGRVGFSKQGAEAAEFNKKLADIQKKQTEFNTERAAAIDPAVQRERGIIAARQATLEKTEDSGERVRLNMEIREARERERRRLREIENAPAVSPQDAVQRAFRSRFRVDREAGRDEQAALERGLEGRRQALAAMNGLSPAQQTEFAARQVRDEQARLNQEIKQNTSAFFPESEANVERRRQLVFLEQTLEALESGATKAANALEIEVTKSAKFAAEQIGQAQADVAKAIESGVPGAVGLRSELDSLTERLQEAQNRLNAAQQLARESGLGGDLAAAEKAKQEVAAIQADIVARDNEVKAIDAVRSSLERFNSALDRVAQEAEQNFQASQRRADEARAVDLGRGGERAGADRARAEADMEEQRQARNRVDQEVARARERAKEDPATKAVEARIAQIDSMLGSAGVLAPGQREELAAERARLERQAEENVRQRVEADDRVRAARDDSTRIEQQQQAAIRGEKLAQTPAQKAADELASQIGDVRQFFGRQAEQGSGLVDFAAQDAAIKQLFQDTARQAAPAIFQLADSVMNAVLQGPSRAALNAADVTTTEGANELNRLIRGDDEAKNQNLVELRQQNQKLSEIINAIKQATGVAVIDL